MFLFTVYGSFSRILGSKSGYCKHSGINPVERFHRQDFYPWNPVLSPHHLLQLRMLLEVLFLRLLSPRTTFQGAFVAAVGEGGKVALCGQEPSLVSAATNMNLHCDSWTLK